MKTQEKRKQYEDRISEKAARRQEEKNRTAEDWGEK